MAGMSSTAGTIANDGFEAFYAEKIWSLIPSIYKDEDFNANTPHQLRAFVEILAKQAATARRSIDRLGDDTSITDCDEWAIPYIGDLFATRLVSPQNPVGRRVDVANTLKYRRRAGTVNLLELLANDITGWDAVASESFKRLHRNWHSLDCVQASGGKTPTGGFANLKEKRIDEKNRTAFDNLAYYPEFRQLRGALGRFNIPKVFLHLYRQFALPLINSTPFQFDAQRYTLDPSGRDASLFMPGREIGDFCNSPKEWEVRSPISCSLLNSAEYSITNSADITGVDNPLTTLFDESFHSAHDIIRRVERLKNISDGTPVVLSDSQVEELLENTIHDDSPKLQLLDMALVLALGQNSGEIVKPFQITAGTLGDWQSSTPNLSDWQDLLVDPDTGRVWLKEDPADDSSHLFTVKSFYGQFYPIGAGTYERRQYLSDTVDHIFASVATNAQQEELNPGPISDLALPGTDSGPVGEGVYQFQDSKTYINDPAANPSNSVEITGDLVIQAANQSRPYILLTPDDGEEEWIFESQITGATLILDGLWLGLLPSAHTETDDGDSPAPKMTKLVLDGSFDKVVLRHMTLDPGGERAKTNPGQTFIIPHVCLELRGEIDELVIERSITGPIVEVSDILNPCSAKNITISDSIIISPTAQPAIATRVASVVIQRSTVVGDVQVARIFASDCIFQGNFCVDDNQNSCLRYSAATDNALSKLPKTYKSVLFNTVIPNHYFVSRRFGDAGFMQLSESAEKSIKRGAENTSEMGAYNSAIAPIKEDDLIFKLFEFTGINVIPQLIKET